MNLLKRSRTDALAGDEALAGAEAPDLDEELDNSDALPFAFTPASPLNSGSVST